MPCPLCDVADSRLFAVYERHKLESCPSCGTRLPGPRQPAWRGFRY